MVDTVDTLALALRCVTAAALAAAGSPCFAGSAKDTDWMLTQECKELSGGERQDCLLGARVWDQYSLASVRTGTSASGKPVGRRILLVAVGPFETGRRAKRVFANQSRALEDIGASLAKDIDLGIRSPDLQMAGALKDPKSQLSAESNRISAEVSAAVNRFLQISAARYMARTTEALHSEGLKSNEFSLAIVETYCSEANGCNLAAYVDASKSEAFQRYGKLSSWLKSKKFTSADVVYRLTLAGDALAPVADPVVRQALGRPWPRQPSAEGMLEDFERLVDRRRAARIDLNYATADALGLSPRSLLAVADIIDSPGYVGPRLQAEGGAALKRSSDELARTRLLECARLRGNFDAAAVGDCAGYKIDFTELVACLNARRCLPTTGQKAFVDLMLVADKAKVKELAVLNVFPRITLGKDESAFRAAAKSCTEKGLAGDEAALCVVQMQAGEKEKKTIACINSARSGGPIDVRALSPCVRQFTENSPVLSNAAECVANAKGDRRAVALCATESQLPESSRKVVECAREAMVGEGQVDKAAVANCLLGKNEQQALACVRKSKDWQQGALCAAGGALPKQVKDAIDCAKSRSTAEAAVCLGGSSVPGDAGRMLKCVAESSFNAMGTALCMAGDNLTVDQRILLQCAITSGGEPTSTATCAAGNLAMKEFNNCKGRNFGEAPCFGPNNDFIRISRQLGIEVGPKSVVADYVNIQLRLLEVPMSAIDKPAQEAMKIASSQAGAIVEGHKALVDAIAKGDIKGAAAQHVKNTCRVLSLGVVKC